MRAVCDSAITASPPDVRRWLCPAVKLRYLEWGATPRSGFFRKHGNYKPGRSPTSSRFTAGRSPCRTSDGEAAMKMGKPRLTDLYGVAVKALNQAVRRNLVRFPEDFMFQLTPEEFEDQKSQIVTSSFRIRLIS